jgi:hypothetical protein
MNPSAVATVGSMRVFATSIAFVIGLIAGCSLTAYFAFKWADTYMSDTAFVGISDRCQVLQTLREGGTNNAVDALEEQLNGEILLFASMKQNIPISELKPSEIGLMRRVRDYRASHPFKEGSGVDESVASILSLTNATLWPEPPLAEALISTNQ